MEAFVPIICLVSLVLAIVIGVVRKMNVGLVAVIFAFAVGYFIVEIPQKDIYVKGWPTQVFFMSIAVMMLFGVAQLNGTMKKLVQGMVYLTKGNDKLLPFAMFIGSTALCALGAGVPFCGALLPIAFAIAVERKIDPLLMCLSTANGVMAGGLSPLAIHGATAASLGGQVGVENYLPIWLCVIITMIMNTIIVYIVQKGYKIPNAEHDKAGAIEKLDKKQMLTLAVILTVVILALVLQYDIGLIAFCGGAFLILLGCADEKEVIKGLPWPIMLLIGGVSILVSVVNAGGGITYLADALSNSITDVTATGIMAILGGLMSAVSSSVGVVMPTLIPIAGELSKSLGVSASALVAGIVVGSNLVVVSPLSTVGGISMASLPENIDKNDFFKKLLFAAVLYTLSGALLGFLGVYGWIVG